MQLELPSSNKTNGKQAEEVSRAGTTWKIIKKGGED